MVFFSSDTRGILNIYFWKYIISGSEMKKLKESIQKFMTVLVYINI